MTTTTKKQNQILNQIIYLNEQSFFLTLSVRLNLNFKTTVFQIKDIHKRISSGKKDINDYSNELKEIYSFYLEFLDISFEND